MIQLANNFVNGNCVHSDDIANGPTKAKEKIELFRYELNLVYLLQIYFNSLKICAQSPSLIYAMVFIAVFAYLKFFTFVSVLSCFVKYVKLV